MNKASKKPAPKNKSAPNKKNTATKKAAPKKNNSSKNKNTPTNKKRKNELLSSTTYL